MVLDSEAERQTERDARQRVAPLEPPATIEERNSGLTTVDTASSTNRSPRFRVRIFQSGYGVTDDTQPAGMTLQTHIHKPINAHTHRCVYVILCVCHTHRVVLCLLCSSQKTVVFVEAWVLENDVIRDSIRAQLGDEIFGEAMNMRVVMSGRLLNPDDTWASAARHELRRSGGCTVHVILRKREKKENDGEGRVRTRPPPADGPILDTVTILQIRRAIILHSPGVLCRGLWTAVLACLWYAWWHYPLAFDSFARLSLYAFTVVTVIAHAEFFVPVPLDSGDIPEPDPEVAPPPTSPQDGPTPPPQTRPRIPRLP